AHPVDVDLDAASAAMGQLAGRARQTGRTQVLDGGDTLQLVELQARFAEQLLEKWVADLYGGTALCRPLVHFHRGKGRPVNPITPSVGTNEEHDVTGVVGPGAAQPLVTNQANTHGVDDRVVGVALVEIHLATDRWTAEAVAVATDTGDNAMKEVTGASGIERTETQRVEDGDRPCSHREDVAQDPADSGGRPLVGFDGGGMIVRLDLEDDGQPIADIDGAGILAGSLEHVRPLGRQLAQ